LLLLACATGCFLLDLLVTSRAALISGIVVNWISGRPVPDVEVRFKEMNGSRPATRTDANGRFTAVAPEDRGLYLLYAGGTEAGSILQAYFGRAVLVPRRGERHSGVVVPAIPPTEVSGHIYGDDAKPLAGCEVAALPEETIYPDGTTKTDNAGAFALTRLGADRYLLSVHCHRYLPGDQEGYNGAGALPWRARNSWLPETKPIVLLPGDRRRGVDFHLQSAPQYSLRGRVIFSNGSSATPGRAFPLTLSVTRLTPLAHAESCSWEGTNGNFRCDFLSPGSYKLTFEEMDGRLDAQIVAEVKAQPRQPELVVPLARREPAPQAPSDEGIGFLNLKRVCEAGTQERWIAVRTWGAIKDPSLPNLQELACGNEETWPVAAGSYLIVAHQLGSFGGGRHSKLDALLRRHGSSVTITKGQTSQLSVQALSIDEIIRMALRYLREADPPFP